jgi:hypothetical protein
MKTEESEQRLVEAVMIMGNRWKQVSVMMDAYSPAKCKARWDFLYKSKELDLRFQRIPS